jgi:hypothetical protein
MAKNKLTSVEVKKSVGKLFDEGGLYLGKRGVNSGRWTFRYKLAGKAREKGLGSFPSVSLAQARSKRDH